MIALFCTIASVIITIGTIIYAVSESRKYEKDMETHNMVIDSVRSELAVKDKTIKRHLHHIAMLENKLKRIAK